MDQVARRQFLRVGLATSAAVLLAGCEGSGQKATGLPGPSWPSESSRRASQPRATPPPTQPAPTGLPQGVQARSEWTRATPIAALADPMGRIGRITIHHDGMTPFYSVNKADAARRLESIRNSHVQRGWADIGYHYIIDPSGRVWQGRPINLQGAHVKDENPGNLGIMVMGNFDSQRPTPAALNSLDQFVAVQMRQYRLSVRNVYTHQELRPTACPGRSLQAYMTQTRAMSGRMAKA
ncbi:MAG: N-acetylmuramoyl-L-alanine amidase [Phycisphaeraceae bacterium]|nr:MAG: N-acetylmuramoyl-L-alanine amidase [Phycisphaeraceae bacterium]